MAAARAIRPSVWALVRFQRIWRINLVLYHGVLAPRAAWRSAVVRYATSGDGRDTGVTESLLAPRDQRATPAETPDTAWGSTRNRLWADLMSRTFRFDVLACPRCGGRLRLIALIEQAAVIERIFRHVGVPAEIPAPRPARAPPLPAGDPDRAGRSDETSVFEPCS